MQDIRAREASMSTKAKQTIDTTDLDAQVREYVTAAATILKTLGPDRSRIGWMLEDALEYLDEIEISEDVRTSSGSRSVPAGTSMIEKATKVANS